MNITAKKVISCALSCILCFGMFPVYGYADEAEPEEALSEQEWEAEMFTEPTIGESTDFLKAVDNGDILIELEEESRREANVKHFYLENGLMFARQYPSEVHYLKDGCWEEIDNRLKETEMENGLKYYVNRNNSFQVSFPEILTEEEGLFLQNRGYSLSFMPKDLQDAVIIPEGDSLYFEESENEKWPENRKESNERMLAVHNESAVRYEEIAEGVDLTYVLSGTELKEGIVIKDSGSFCEGFSFSLQADGMNVFLEEDGSIECLNEENEEIFFIPAPYMYEECGDQWGNVNIELEESETGTFLITYRPDPDWLSDPDRSFPVVIDPTVVSDKTTTSATGTYIASENTAFNGINSYFLTQGKTTNGNERRSFIKINELPTLSASDTIVNATLFCRGDYKIQIAAYMIEEDHIVDYSQITWSDQPQHNEKPLDFSVHSDSDVPAQFDITKAARAWYDGSVINNGIAFISPSDITKTGRFDIGSGRKQAYISLLYINTDGIENCWDYSSISMGRAGKAYVQDFSGNFVLERTDLSFGGLNAPAAIGFAYNYSDKDYSFGYGNGIRCTYAQTIEECQLLKNGGTDPTYQTYYKWTDSDGTKIYALKQLLKQDELGLGYTFKSSGSGALKTYTITNKQHDQLIFDNFGRLVKVRYYTGKIGSGSSATEHYNEILITYISDSADQLRINTVTDGAGRVYQFFYSSDTGDLSSVSYYGTGTIPLKTVSYTYSEGKLSGVTYPDGKSVSYEWDGNDLISVCNIQKEDETRDQLSILYSADTAFCPGKATRLRYFSENVLASELNFEYMGHYTKVTDLAGRFLEHHFNSYGNTVSVYNDRGQALYGRYAKDSDPAAMPNQLVASSRLQETVVGAEELGFELYDGFNNENINLLSRDNVLADGDMDNEASSAWVIRHTTAGTYRPRVLDTDPADGYVEEYGDRANLDENAVCLHGIANEAKELRQVIQRRGSMDDTVTFGAWVKYSGTALCPHQYNSSSSIDSLAGIRIRFYWDEDHGENEEYFPVNPEFDGWQYISGQVSAENPYREIQFSYVFQNGLGEMWCDGAQMFFEPGEYHYYYNDKGYLTCLTYPNGSRTRYQYSDENDLSHIQFDDGTNYYYNYNAHKLTSSSSFGGVTTNYYYDTYGNVTGVRIKGVSSTDPKIQTNNTYTADGNLKASVTTGDRQTITYENDTDLSLINSETDPKGNTTSYVYDTMGRLLSASSCGSTVENTYEDDLLTGICHSNSSTRDTEYSFEYGLGGLLLTAGVGNNTLVTNSYNSGTWTRGQQLYGNGDYWRYEYDESDLIEERYTSIGNGEALAFDYYYNAEGDLCRTEKFAATISGTQLIDKTQLSSDSYIYNNSGQTVRYISAEPQNGSAAERLLLDASWTYDPNGAILTLSERINKGNGLQSFDYSYTYDNDKQLSVVEYGNVDEAYAYDRYGRIESKTFNYGGAPLYESDFSYRSIGTEFTTVQFNEISSSFGSNTLTHCYDYDENGNITEDTCNGETTLYEYDALNQLVWEKNEGAEKAWHYSYDLGGNIVEKTEYDYVGGTLSNARQICYTYGDNDWADLLTNYNGQSISYDGLGNPTTYRGWTLDWFGGRFLGGAEKGSVDLTFDYNEAGLRTEKTNGNVHTKYIWNGNALAAELGPNGSFFYHYNPEGNLVGYTYEPLNGSPLECALVKNQQGDVERVLSSSGEVLAAYTYDAWGNVLSAAGDLAEINHIRYRSYYQDDETGLYYIQSRYYDPEVGRFISPDDVSMLGADGKILSYNLFAYCQNDPLSCTDDGGEFANFVIGAAVGAAFGAVSALATGGNVAAGAIAGAVSGLVSSYLPPVLLKECANLAVVSAARFVMGAAANVMDEELYSVMTTGNPAKVDAGMVERSIIEGAGNGLGEVVSKAAKNTGALQQNTTWRPEAADIPAVVKTGSISSGTSLLKASSQQKNQQTTQKKKSNQAKPKKKQPIL